MIQAYQLIARINAGEVVEIPAIRLDQFFAQAARLPGPIELAVVIDGGMASISRSQLVAAR